MAKRRKTNIRIGDQNSLQDLMKEAYDDAYYQMVDVTSVSEQLDTKSKDITDIDGLTKLAKAKADFFKLRDSAIRVKLEVAKLQTEFVRLTKTEPENDMPMFGGGSNIKVGTDMLKKVRENLKNQTNDNDLTNI